MEPTQEAISEALAAWGILEATVSDLAGGAANQHWRVDAPGIPTLVLRRYHPRQTTGSVAYEHRLLHFLARMEWPVAAPLTTEEGSQLQNESGHWALFPFLHGEPPDRSPRSLQRKGAILALLHTDMRDWEQTEQRPGFGRTTDLDTPLRLDGFADFDALIAWESIRNRERAERFEAIRQRNWKDLQERGVESLTDEPVYYECLGNNVLFIGDEATALLDFDLAHRDARIADLARTMAFEAGLDVDLLKAVVSGYRAHATPPLTLMEIDMLPPMMLAAEIWTTAVGLAISDRYPAAWLERSTRLAIDERLPALEAALGDLRRDLMNFKAPRLG